MKTYIARALFVQRKMLMPIFNLKEITLQANDIHEAHYQADKQLKAEGHCVYIYTYQEDSNHDSSN